MYHLKGEVLTKDILVLIVDDEESLRQAISRVLSMFVSTITAANPQEALEKVDYNDVSLCLIDQNLRANLTGIDLAKKIKEKYPNMKIIMLTGESDSQVVIDALNSSAIDSFLSKPFQVEELKEYISENLSSKFDQESKIANVINKIREGNEISDEEISIIADDMENLEMMMFDYRIKALPEEDNDTNLIGVVVFDQVGIIYKQIFDNEFTINDEFMFRGLIVTLSKLSEELFTLDSKATLLDEIKLPNLHVKVSTSSEYGFVVILSGNKDIPHPIDVEVKEFFEKVVVNIGDQFENENSDILDLEVAGLYQSIADYSKNNNY